jgi:hypothetical protein
VPLSHVLFPSDAMNCGSILGIEVTPVGANERPRDFYKIVRSVTDDGPHRSSVRGNESQQRRIAINKTIPVSAFPSCHHVPRKAHDPFRYRAVRTKIYRVGLYHVE